MSSSPPSTKRKTIRELSSIANQLLYTKTMNSLSSNNGSSLAMSSIENTPNYLNSMSEQKFDHLRSKPMDNIGALLQFYQTLANANGLNTSNEKNSSFNLTESNQQTSSTKKTRNADTPSSTKKALSTTDFTPMTYLCRFYQRNRLIEIPQNNDFFQQNGISHENLKQLILQEFHLSSSVKDHLIVQIWNDQYQDYIDIESFKKIPSEGRLQVFVDKENSTGNEKSPSTPLSSYTTTTAGRSMTPNPNPTTPEAHRLVANVQRQSNVKEEIESSPQISHRNEPSYDDSMNTISPMRPVDNFPCNGPNVMYDLLPKPNEGIPIPRFPPHIAAFLNGNGDANQLNALVQALYQEIVKYELYPNADELRSIVSRLVERYPNSISVIGSVELLVRKLYYKFCNERKKYPVELKRRQPNKRKRLVRDEEPSMIGATQISALLRRHENLSNDFQQPSLDRLMHLWTTATGQEYQNNEINTEQGANSPSASSSASSSPVSAPTFDEKPNEVPKSYPLNLSSSGNVNPFMCTE